MLLQTLAAVVFDSLAPAAAVNHTTHYYTRLPKNLVLHASAEFLSYVFNERVRGYRVTLKKM